MYKQLHLISERYPLAQQKKLYFYVFGPFYESFTVLYCIVLYCTILYCTVDVKELLQFISVMKITSKN